MKILVTGFEPFGIMGRILNRNDSKICALKLKKLYPEIEILILPVDDTCIKIIKRRIGKYNPDLIFSMGMATSLRIETRAISRDKKDEFLNPFTEKIRKEFNTPEDIGNYYCNHIYYTALISKVKKVIFIHVPLFVDFDEIRKIFERTIEYAREN